jgi:plasmid stability protein
MIVLRHRRHRPKLHALHAGFIMTQITIRRLDRSTVEKLKKRAAAAGRSMEEEIRNILSDAVEDDGLAQRLAWLKEMRELRQRIFGDKVLPDSTPIIRRMRAKRTRQIKKWALPQ